MLVRGVYHGSGSEQSASDGQLEDVSEGGDLMFRVRMTQGGNPDTRGPFAEGRGRAYSPLPTG